MDTVNLSVVGGGIINAVSVLEIIHLRNVVCTITSPGMKFDSLVINEPRYSCITGSGTSFNMRRAVVHIRRPAVFRLSTKWRLRRLVFNFDSSGGRVRHVSVRMIALPSRLIVVCRGPRPWRASYSGHDFCERFVRCSPRGCLYRDNRVLWYIKICRGWCMVNLGRCNRVRRAL
jgi:hypothetical protein